MDRLTNADGVWRERMDADTINRLYKRLAAYEDTGLTPEEIMSAEDRRHACKIECLLREYNKLDAALGIACEWLEEANACTNLPDYIGDRDQTCSRRQENGACVKCLRDNFLKQAKEQEERSCMDFL